jgi:hypothetical protein
MLRSLLGQHHLTNNACTSDLLPRAASAAGHSIVKKTGWVKSCASNQWLSEVNFDPLRYPCSLDDH